MYVHVKLISAQNLPKKDLLSKNDCYVKLEYNNIIKTSQVMKNIDTIIWTNEEFIFPYSKKAKKVKVTLYDKDALDDIIISEEFSVLTNNFFTHKTNNLTIQTSIIEIFSKQSLDIMKQETHNILSGANDVKHLINSSINILKEVLKEEKKEKKEQKQKRRTQKKRY